jgi:UDP:flavonoid glycosyltransferase YjiC (YdhE family)
MPYSMLLPHACAIVHQATGQAWRAGGPTLVVPYRLDQPDNAARAERLGTSLTVPRRHYRARRVTPLLTELLQRADYARRAETVGRLTHAEDAARVACDAIEHRLSQCALDTCTPRVR